MYCYYSAEYRWLFYLDVIAPPVPMGLPAGSQLVDIKIAKILASVDESQTKLTISFIFLVNTERLGGLTDSFDIICWQ